MTIIQPPTIKDMEDIFTSVLNVAIETKIAPMIERIVGETVGEIVSDALKLIDARFNVLEARFDAIDDRFDAINIRFDELNDTIGHHTIDIRALHRKTP